MTTAHTKVRTTPRRAGGKPVSGHARPPAARTPHGDTFEAPDNVNIKRAYEAPAESDGRRVLVDRLWPRGAKKESLALDDWLKSIAPSDSLRRWFAHDPARWAEFSERYEVELQAPEVSQLLDSLAQEAHGGPVTLVYGARDPQHNHALILQRAITRRLRPPSRKNASSRHRT